MTRKEEIRNKIKDIEQRIEDLHKQIKELSDRKEDLINEGLSLPKEPYQVIADLLKKENHKIYACIPQSTWVFVHADLSNDLSEITGSIFKETKHSLMGFEIQPDGSYYIWFEQFA